MSGRTCTAEVRHLGSAWRKGGPALRSTPALALVAEGGDGRRHHEGAVARQCLPPAAPREGTAEKSGILCGIKNLVEMDLFSSHF